jgi:hypothetical protein
VKRIPSLFVLVALLAASMFLMNCSGDISTSPNNANDQVSNTDFAAEKPFSFETDVLAHSDLSVKAINGTIVITEAPNSNSVKISGKKRVESESAEDAEAHLKELEVDVQNLTGEIFVRTVQPKRSEGRNYVVDYTITLPKNMDVSVNSLNSRVTLDGILGSVFVDLINGAIHSKVTLPQDGTIDMSLINGIMELEIPKQTSAELSARVVNGNIGVSNLDLQNKTETSKFLRGTCGDGRGAISLITTNGNIYVTGF